MNKNLILATLFILSSFLTTNGSAQENRSAKQAAIECNEKSAHPQDHLSGVTGVTWEELDVEAAREACVKVFTLGGPITGQLLYQSARLLDKDGDSKSVSYLRQAIKDFQYPIAYFHLGRLYEDGRYVKKDSTRAIELFREGFKRGSLVAGISLSWVLGEDSKTNAYSQLSYLRSLRALSEKGHEPARNKLKELRASGYIANHNKLFPHNRFE